MDEDQIISKIAFIVSLLAFFGVIGVGCYAYFGETDEVDLSGIYENRIVINELAVDISDVRDDIANIDTTCNCEIDEDDLEDLEEMIEDTEDDINNNENDIDDILYCIKHNNNVTAVRECLN